MFGKSNKEMFYMFTILKRETVLPFYLEEGKILTEFSRLYRKGYVTRENFRTPKDAKRVASWILDKYYDWGGDEWPSYQNANS